MDSPKKPLIRTELSKKSIADKEFASLDLLSFLVTETDNSIIITDTEGRIEYVNNGFTNMTGYSFDEVLGKKPGSFLQGPLTNVDTKREIHDALKMHKPVNTEIINYYKNDTYYWVSLVINPVFDKSGNLKRFVSIQKKISEVMKQHPDQSFNFKALYRRPMIIEFDMDGFIINANENFLTLFGFTLQDIIGKHHRIFVEPNYSESHEYTWLWESVKNGATKTEEIKCLSKSGKEIWLLSNYSREFDTTREVYKVVKFALDITDQKQEQARNLLLSSIVTSSNDAIISKTLEGIITSWNVGAEKLYGFTANEARGKHISIVFPEQNLAEEAKIIAKIKRGEKVAYYDAKRLTKDGRLVDVSLMISPVYDTKGTIIGASKIAHDITGIKEIQKKLQESEERYDLAVRGMSVGLWDWNVQTGELYWSDKFKEIIGIDKDFKGTYEEFSSRLHPEDKESTEKVLFNHIENKTPYNVEYRFRRTEGNYTWIHATGQAQWDESGKAMRMAGSVDDISEKKQAEKLAEMLKNIAMHANKESLTDDLILNSLNEIGRAMELSLGHAYLWDRSKNKLVTSNLWFIHPEKIGKFDEFIKLTSEYEFESGIGLPGAVHAKQTLIWIDDFTQGSNWPRIRSLTNKNIRTTFSFPVFVNNKILYVFEFFNDSFYKKNPTVHSIFKVVGDQLGRSLERKKAQIKQKKLIEQLASLNLNLVRTQDAISKAVEGISRIDAGGCYISLNEAYAGMAGYKVEELVGKNWTITVHSEDMPLLEKAYTDMLRDGKVTAEARGIKKDGSTFYKSLTMISEYDQSGTFVGHHCFMQDITERKKQELMLQKSEERFNLVAEGMSVGIWDWDILTGEMHWSRKLYELFGIEDYTIKPNLDFFSSLLHPDDKDRVIKVLSNHLKHRTSYDIEYRVRWPNGKYVWAHAAGKALWDENNKPYRMAGSVVDINSRKTAEEERKNLLTIIEESFDYIGMADMEGNLLYHNRSARRMIGLPDDFDLSGKKIADMHTKWANEVLSTQAIPQCLTTGSWSGETAILHRDGHEIPVLQSLTLHYDEKKNPIFVSTIIRSIIERKQQENQLESLADKLLESNTQLERFAYIASHDMQEPIRMITNFSQIIASDYTNVLDDEGKEFLKIVVNAGIRMHDMIEDLLDYSRLGKENMQMEEFDGENILNSVRENLHSLLDEKKVTITHDALPKLYGNPVQILRLLQNLVVNGVKYQPIDNSPKIHISMEETDEHWRISVQDNGLGIKPEFIDVIFQPFRRLHAWDKISGTGLGLSICKKIVENHGGSIEVTSEFGKECIFSFSISKPQKRRPHGP